ncbi:MAG: hypothetical protein AAF604_18025 [Acidobacteriota bacterium]
MKTNHLVAWSGLAVLLVLHLDFWRPQRPQLWLGWIPEELAWRLGWLALASLYLWFFTRFVWRDE